MSHVLLWRPGRCPSCRTQVIGVKTGFSFLGHLGLIAVLTVFSLGPGILLYPFAVWRERREPYCCPDCGEPLEPDRAG